MQEGSSPCLLNLPLRFYSFTNVRPLGHNSPVRTSLPIKHSYRPHKRCRWDTDFAINPYIFIRLTCLAYFFFLIQLHFPGTLLQSITLFLYTQFREWNCHSKGLFPLVGGLAGLLLQKIIQVDSQNSKKFCSISRNRGSPSSLMWPRQNRKGREVPPAPVLYPPQPQACHLEVQALPCRLTSQGNPFSLPQSSLTRTYYYLGNQKPMDPLGWQRSSH